MQGHRLDQDSSHMSHGKTHGTLDERTASEPMRLVEEKRQGIGGLLISGDSERDIDIRVVVAKKAFAEDREMRRNWTHDRIDPETIQMRGLDMFTSYGRSIGKDEEQFEKHVRNNVNHGRVECRRV